MVQSVYHLISSTLNDNKIQPIRLAKALYKVVSTLQLYNENIETECLLIRDTIKDTKDFIIILELCELFRKIGKINNQYQCMKGQKGTENMIVKIFLDELAEKDLEGEALLIKRLSSVNLRDNLFYEKWKVKFLDEEEDEQEEEIFERYILIQRNENII